MSPQDSYGPWLGRIPLSWDLVASLNEQLISKNCKEVVLSFRHIGLRMANVVAFALQAWINQTGYQRLYNEYIKRKQIGWNMLGLPHFYGSCVSQEKIRLVAQYVQVQVTLDGMMLHATATTILFCLKKGCKTNCG